MGLKNTTHRTVLALGGFAMAFASSTALADSGGKWASGREVYDKVCGYCHEPNPGLGPNIKGAHPRDVRERVRNGHRAMPAFRQSEIDEQALAQLIEFLK